MNATFVFSTRNQKELLRDPLNILFALGFPIVVLLLLTAIQHNVPVSLFAIEQIAPGIACFGLSFFALFAGLLIARDRTSSFLTRLFASPMKPAHFIIGYTLPLLPLALLQSIICLGVAFVLGLTPSLYVLAVLGALIPTAVLYIALGLLAGSLFNDKQVGGICGALLTNLSAWLSGTWFNLELVGGTFKTLAYCLPFAHAADAGKAAFAGNFSAMFMHLIWVSVYAVVILAVAIWVFRRKMLRATP